MVVDLHWRDGTWHFDEAEQRPLKTNQWVSVDVPADAAVDADDKPPVIRFETLGGPMTLTAPQLYELANRGTDPGVTVADAAF